MDGAAENSLGKGIMSRAVSELLLRVGGHGGRGHGDSVSAPAGLGAPAAAFLLCWAPRVPCPAHSRSAHRTLPDPSLCLSCQHSPKQVLLQRVGVSRLLCTAVFLLFFLNHLPKMH